MSHRDIFLFNTGGGDCPPCPAPEDGVWKDGEWQGPEPAAYQSCGWNRDLVDLDGLEISDIVGATKEQIMAGLSVTAQGYLLWSFKNTVTAGASLAHSFTLRPAFDLWESNGIQFISNFFRSTAPNYGLQEITCGLEAVDENRNPIAIAGAANGLIYEGYRSTSSNSAQIRRHFDAEDSTAVGSGFGGHALIFNPQFEQMDLMKLGIGKYKTTNTASHIVIDDPRPNGATLENVYWRPFIKIETDGVRPSSSEFSMLFYSFKVFGTPKT